MMFSFSHKHSSDNRRRSKKIVKPIKRPIQWLKPLLYTASISGFIFVMSLATVKLNQTFTVEYWNIEADKNIKPEIEQYLASLEALDFWHTRASVIQRGLLGQTPDIQDLQISRVLPNGLLVKATARQPFGLWKSTQVSQQIMLVDEKGQPYRAIQRGEDLDLPVLWVDEDALPRAIQVLHQLKQKNAKKFMNLSEVIVVENDWRFNFSKGEQWKLKGEGLERDINSIAQILTMPRWVKGYWRLDARIPQRWFVRPARQEVI